MMPLLETLLEDQLERSGQVLAHLVRVAVRELEVEQIPELDRLGVALVGHVTPPVRTIAIRQDRSGELNLIFVPTLPLDRPAGQRLARLIDAVRLRSRRRRSARTIPRSRPDRR